MATLEYAVIIFIVLMLSIVLLRFKDSIVGIYNSGTEKVVAMRDALAGEEYEYEKTYYLCSRNTINWIKNESADWLQNQQDPSGSILPAVNVRKIDTYTKRGYGSYIKYDGKWCHFRGPGVSITVNHQVFMASYLIEDPETGKIKTLGY